jgi:hypothetical protein
MTVSVLREKVIEEIYQIPEEKLTEVYNFIHFFRIGFQTSRHIPNTQEILNAVNNIYGLWEDREIDVDEYIRDLRKDRSYDHAGY